MPNNHIHTDHTYSTPERKVTGSEGNFTGEVSSDSAHATGSSHERYVETEIAICPSQSFTAPVSNVGENGEIVEESVIDIDECQLDFVANESNVPLLSTNEKSDSPKANPQRPLSIITSVENMDRIKVSVNESDCSNDSSEERYFQYYSKENLTQDWTLNESNAILKQWGIIDSPEKVLFVYCRGVTSESAERVLIVNNDMSTEVRHGIYHAHSF